MIDFRPDGKAIVSWEIEGTNKRLKISLKEYLELTTDYQTQKELQALLFARVPKNARAQRVKAA